MINIAVDFEMINRVLPVTFDDCCALAVDFALDPAPYDGDTVTFTANVKAGATWHGWYSDAACTQLLSTSRIYTTAASDLTLYAKATAAIGTGIYIKPGGTFAEAQTAYRKISGAWVEQSDIDAVKQELQNGNYKIK